MKKLNISNDIIMHTPKMGVITQKILYLIIQKIISEKKYTNIGGFELEMKKSDIYGLYDDDSNNRKKMYEYMDPIMRPIHISHDDDHYYTAIISGIKEKKRVDTIELSINTYISNIIRSRGHYFLLDFLIFAKLEKKVSIIIYQYLCRYKNQGRFSLSATEFNSILQACYASRDLYILLKIAQTEIGQKTDLDFTIEVNKKDGKKIFNIGVICKEGFLYDNSDEMRVYVIDNYQSHIDSKDILSITQFINGLNDYQTDVLYNHLRNKRQEVDKSIMMKIEGATTGYHSTHYYKTICQVIMFAKYSDISKTIDKCSIEVSRGKIKDKIAFTLARLKQLINDDNILLHNQAG